MRFKYYLRGAGIGVILTTLIFTIAFAVYKPTLSDDEIMKKAEALGMEMPADDSDSADKKDTKTAKDQKDDADASDSNTDDATTSEDGGQKNVIEFTIASGDTSATIAQHLQEVGLVDNAKSFDLYLSDQDLDNQLLPGTYQIPEGATFLEIGELLTAKQAQ
ncbi:MAG: hypothetical protein SOZ30_00880 [Roseburia lenta]|nr:hypothetical protein [Roseburia lenta]